MGDKFRVYSLTSIPLEKSKSAHFNDLLLDEGEITYETRCTSQNGEEAQVSVKAIVSKATVLEKEKAEDKVHEDASRGCDVVNDFSCSVQVCSQLQKRFHGNTRMLEKTKALCSKVSTLKGLDQLCEKEDTTKEEGSNCHHYLSMQGDTL